MSNTVAKAELEKMLELLNTNIIDAINRKIVTESPYTFGIKPLLTYAPETLVKYLAAIITFVVEPLEGVGADLSEEEVDAYCMKWLVHYDRVRDALSEASTELKARLLRIAETPPALEPPLVYDKCNEYTQIRDYFDGNSYELYPQFADFLYSGLSPLRRRYITDQRILDLTKEADDLLVPHNKALERFIRRELNRLRSLVNGRIRYANLESADINYLKDNKNHLPEVEWQSLENALNVGSLSGSDLKSIKARIMELKKPVPLPAPPKPLMPADDYIDFFLGELELAYGRFNDKRTEFYSDPLKSTLDDILAGVYAVELAKAQNNGLANLASIEEQQKKAEQFYLDFSNLKPLLNACIQIDLNSLSIDKIFTPETQEHKVIQAMLAFTAKHKAYFKCRYKPFNYDHLVEELHHLLHEHTKGFTEALPSLSIEPLTAEAVASTPKAPRLTANILPYFDLTMPVAKVLGDISADTATADAEFLLEMPSANSLVPVQDGTIKALAKHLTGSEQSLPYLLNGDLIVHNTEAGEYIKILPTIRDDDYADYIFNVYGYTTLLRRVLKLQKLLNVKGYSPTYNAGQKAHQKAVSDLAEWDKTLIAQANELSACEGYEHVQAELRKILSIHYYKTIYISAHKLAAYTFYPAEYTTFISAKPTDPTTGEPLIYHVHHKDGCRSNNAPENLSIITKQLNDELRSTSRPVIYQGTKYNTLKSYCEATEAGARTKLTERLSALTPGTEAIEYNGRLYTIDTVGVITATDDTATTPTITYSGVTYANLKEFANAHKLVYKSLHNALSKARKENKTSFKYKYHQFYLDDKGNIIEVTK
jgi:hypothetical protein